MAVHHAGDAGWSKIPASLSASQARTSTSFILAVTMFGNIEGIVVGQMIEIVQAALARFAHGCAAMFGAGVVRELSAARDLRSLDLLLMPRSAACCFACSIPASHARPHTRRWIRSRPMPCTVAECPRSTARWWPRKTSYRTTSPPRRDWRPATPRPEAASPGLTFEKPEAWDRTEPARWCQPDRSRSGFAGDDAQGAVCLDLCAARPRVVLDPLAAELIQAIRSSGVGSSRRRPAGTS